MNLHTAIVSLAALLLQTASTTGFTVSGRVTHPGYTISTNEKVTLAGGRPVRSVDADVNADGSFSFAGILPGTYRITVNPGLLAQPANLTVVNTNIAGIEIVNPRVVELSGKVIMDGGGLLPSFMVSFSPFSGGQTATASSNGLDTFRTQLTDSNYRVSWDGLPEGYVIRSIVAGQVDLLLQPLSISGSAPVPSVVVTLGASSPPPWVRVRGRVTGLPPAAQGVRNQITLSGRSSGVPSLNVFLMPDGSFEFPTVLPGSYVALIYPNPPLALENASIYVGKTNLDGLVLSTPVTRCVPGRVVVEGDGPMPNLTFALANPVSSSVPAPGAMTVSVSPSDSGIFGVLLPEGERRIVLGGGSIPPGYTLTSFNYGTTNLLQQPLQVSVSNTAELSLTFATAPGSWANVGGRVTGIDPALRRYRVSIGSLRVPDVVLGNDGTFRFGKVLRGNYTLRLTSLGGIDVSKTITVGGQDMNDVEIAAPPQREVTGRVLSEGGRPAGIYSLALTGASGSHEIQFFADNDGRFQVALPEGENQVSLRQPPGSVQSLTYGNSDLLKGPLRVSRTDTAELRLTLSPGTSGSVVGGVFTGVRNDCSPQR